MQPLKITVMISGGGTNLEALIRATRTELAGASVVQVISSREDAYGLVRARNFGIPERTLPLNQQNQPDSQKTTLLKWLQAYETELVVLAGYLKKIPDDVLSAYGNRIINIHPSLIPAFSGPGWYGMKIHEAVWARGVKITGATAHFVNDEMDGGPIILQEAVVLSETDSPESIQRKVLAVEHSMLPCAVRLYMEGRLLVEGQRVKILNEVRDR
jgi:phosphoribosylglycinamide formyltransferase 1